jgi:hypothetical protein
LPGIGTNSLGSKFRTGTNCLAWYTGSNTKTTVAVAITIHLHLHHYRCTSNDIIAPPMCQVSEIYSKRSDLISSAKVEVGSLALVDFCRIFGSSWFQSFNVFGIKLSLKISVRACGIWNWWLCHLRCFLLLWLMSEMGMFAYPLSPLCSRMSLFSCLRCFSCFQPNSFIIDVIDPSSNE